MKNLEDDDEATDYNQKPTVKSPLCLIKHAVLDNIRQSCASALPNTS